MILPAGFVAAVVVLVAADHAAGTSAAFPFALLVCAGAVLLALVDGGQRR